MTIAAASPRPDLEGLAARLGHRFGRWELLREALTHPSTAPELRGGARHGYERLEFLGDRVLGLVVAELLVERFPGEPEGALAKRHTALVRKEALAEAAEAIDLGRHLILSSGEEGSGGRLNQAILADACEAVIAALYLDGGLEPARRFIHQVFGPAVDTPGPPEDPKTALQEWAQGRGRPLPVYTTLSRSGPDHDPEFEVEVSVVGETPATGRGSSKRAAAKAAAAALLARLNRD